MPVRGNYMCTDDTEQDKADEDEVIERLNRGEIEAWCRVVVIAEWEGYKGYASIGGCVFGSASEAAQMAIDYDLHDEALEDLNRQIEADLSRSEAIRAKLDR